MTDTATRIGIQRPRLWHLPAEIGSTDAGDEVIEFAERFGLVLDDWQRWVVRHMCAERSDGSLAATQAVLLVPRQAGKSACLEAIEMAALFLWDYEHVIYSAHLQKTSTDHMRRIRRHINRAFKNQARVKTGKGDEMVERFDNGAILEFITRGAKTSRGGSPGLVVFDEALFLQDDQIQAMLPSLSAQSMNEDASAQMIYTSSAPLETSTVLHRLRDRGMKDKPRRMFFAEWSAESDCDPADRENWYLANPGLGIRISEEWVEDNEFGTLSDAAFKTERLGVPEPLLGTARPIKLPAAAWAATGIPAAVAERVEDRVYAYDVSLDGGWSSIASAGGSLQTPYVEVFEHKQGVGWLPDRLTELALKHPEIQFVCNGAGPAGAQVGPVLAAFAAAHVSADRLTQLSAVEYKQACGGFYTDVTEGRLKRPADGQGALDLAAGDATERTLGDAWAWDIRSATVPISPLVAVTLARALLPMTGVNPVDNVW